ncbi:MAG TPA: tetratricopeptide repeat protein [Rhizomicrobium sp.]|nr:tetratricopeptide repeat protein [Rhizomicrobium sp.]
MTSIPSRELYAQALALQRQGQLAQAETLYRRVVAAEPSAFPPRHMLGVVLAQQGKLAEAQTEMDAALKLNPRDAGAWANYGNVLNLLGRHGDAVASYDRALAISPDAGTWNNRGNALQSLNRRAEAVASFERALALEPNNVQAWFTRGLLLGELGRADEAMDSYNRALALNPGHVEALNNRGYLWWLNKQRYAPAIADLEQSLGLAPDLAYGQGAVLHLKMYAADWSEFGARRAALLDGVRAGKRVARPFMFQAVAENPGDLQACARLYARDQYPPPPQTPPHDREGRKPRAKIRLGYVSGEFRDQATAILMAGLYERHDRSRFEVIAVDNGSADNSAMTARLKRAFDGWIDIGDLTGAQAAAKIREAEIDILVNLNGYFGKHRMDVFAHRPAPLQVNYLGFPGTLGANYIDYIIADATVIPPREHHFYDEQVVTLPGCYQVNDDRGRAIALRPSRTDAGVPEQGFVFCNFNQSYKLTPDVFASWMRILARVENSVLWLLAAVDPFAENIAAQARTHGVAPQRILFAPDRPPAQHLARLSLADLFLDGLPYNAHTTGSDALWAGVPLLTRRGTAFPGRVAASLLAAAGLPELVTESVEDYENLAVRLATDPNALAAIKARLTRDCPLFDTDLFRRTIEAAYGRMWEMWLDGKKPRGFSI